MERTREEQMKSLSRVIHHLQEKRCFEMYDDIMNLIALFNDLHKERL